MPGYFYFKSELQKNATGWGNLIGNQPFEDFVAQSWAGLSASDKQMYNTFAKYTYTGSNDDTAHTVTHTAPCLVESGQAGPKIGPWGMGNEETIITPEEILAKSKIFGTTRFGAEAKMRELHQLVGGTEEMRQRIDNARALYRAPCCKLGYCKSDYVGMNTSLLQEHSAFQKRLFICSGSKEALDSGDELCWVLKASEATPHKFGHQCLLLCKQVAWGTCMGHASCH